MKSVSPNKVDSDLIAMNEIFTSVQGEGAQIGRPVIFTRVSKCNMSCYFCDTNYQPVWLELTSEQLMTKIEMEFHDSFQAGIMNEPAVLLTGGEPSIYKLEPLLKMLKDRDYWVGIESNGRNDFSEWRQYIDHITISPKAPKGLGMRVADEVRLVTQQWVDIFYLAKLEKEIDAEYYFLSPMADANGEFDFSKVYKLLDDSRRYCDKEWRLSLQTHKLAGIK